MNGASSEPWVLGIAASHNGAACILRGDRLVVAIQEERLSGHKRASIRGGHSSLAVRYCLQAAGISAGELHAVGLAASDSLAAPGNRLSDNPDLGVIIGRVPLVAMGHHFAHAVSAWVASGFDDAAVLVIDGAGSPNSDLTDAERAAVLGGVDGRESASIYRAAADDLTPVEKHITARGEWLGQPPPGSAMLRFGSLGGLFSSVADLLFGDSMEAGKVMGLAPYGRAVHPVDDFLSIDEDGGIEFTDELPRRLGSGPLDSERARDLAASAQAALEVAVLHLAARARRLCGSRRLAYAGGVALNSVANERIIREAGFDDTFVIPAAEDSGTALGAAHWALRTLTGRVRTRRMHNDSTGRPYVGKEIGRAIRSVPGLREVPTLDVLGDAADLLATGHTVGWFQGGAELGPRALGHRSILCDPRRPDAKDTLNRRVKHREPFRPFAPVVPLDMVDRWFEVDDAPTESPFMLRVVRFRPEVAESVPGVVHVDGTGRLQTVTRRANRHLHALIGRFAATTNVPVLLNTSYNVMGEPIVETPEDALWALQLTGLDYAVIEESMVTSEAGFSRGQLVPRPLISPSDVRRVSRQSGPALGFDVTTPWGPSDFPYLEARTVPMVEQLLVTMDGRRTVDEIERHLRDRFEELTEHQLVRMLARLRRGRVIELGWP